jgi:hypothetical protein
MNAVHNSLSPSSIRNGFLKAFIRDSEGENKLLEKEMKTFIDTLPEDYDHTFTGV